MEAENKEFMALLDASGWSQAEAARRLYLAPSNITQYKKNDNRPSRQVLELFKVILASEKPEALGAMVLREGETKVDETALWRRRAKAAEGELADLKTSLRKLIEKPSSKIGAAADAEVESAVSYLRQKKPA